MSTAVPTVAPTAATAQVNAACKPGFYEPTDTCRCSQVDANSWNFFPSNLPCKPIGGGPYANGVQCCTPDPASCPQLSLSSGPTDATDAPQVLDASGCLYKTACPALCSYPLNSFREGRDAHTYLLAFGADQYNQRFMPAFCQQPADPSDCPPDPVTGQRWPACSRFVSTGDDGARCRDWASKNADLADSARNNYCNNYDTQDCGCINAPRNSIFRAIQPVTGYNRGCWWLPCTQPSSYLVTQAYVPSPATGGCPSAICESVINNIHSSHIDLADVKQYVSCGTAPPPPPPPPPLVGPSGAALAPLLGGALAIAGLAALAYIVSRWALR